MEIDEIKSKITELKCIPSHARDNSEPEHQICVVCIINGINMCAVLDTCTLQHQFIDWTKEELKELHGKMRKSLTSTKIWFYQRS